MTVRNTYLFVAREAQPSDVAELFKIRLHLLFVEAVRYPAEIDHTTVLCLDGV